MTEVQNKQRAGCLQSLELNLSVVSDGIDSVLVEQRVDSLKEID